MTYSESFPDRITRKELVIVLKEHYAFDDIQDFYTEHGFKDNYSSDDVLAWLGY